MIWLLLAAFGLTFAQEPEESEQVDSVVEIEEPEETPIVLPVEPLVAVIEKRIEAQIDRVDLMIKRLESVKPEPERFDRRSLGALGYSLEE